MPFARRKKNTHQIDQIKISSHHGYLYCSECSINPYNEIELIYGYMAFNLGTMLAHIQAHKTAGEHISDSVVQELFEHEGQHFPEGGTSGSRFTMGYSLPPHWEQMLTQFSPTHQ